MALRAIRQGGEVDQRRAPPQNGGPLLDPRLHAAALVSTFKGTDENVSLASILDEVSRIIKLPAKAKLAHIERTLTGQALALQSIFSCFAMRAESTQLIPHFEIYAAVALKAQRQCRATLVALADVLSPARATFIKNNAHTQQVNIGSRSPMPRLPRENTQKSRNELISRRLPHAAMDKNRTLTASETDSPVAAVATIDRTTHAAGKGPGEPKRAKARALRSGA